MASVNRMTLLGNVGQDPEVKFLSSGTAVCNLSVATTYTWKDKTSGEKKSETEWHRVVLMGRTAEVAGEYLKKGSSVYIEGRLRTRKWEKDGVERYSTEIMGDSMQLLGGKGERQETPAPAPSPKAAALFQAKANADRVATGFDDFADDLPF